MNQARIASSNRTGLVYKISFALVLLLGLLVYKLNDYFKNDKTYAMQTQIRKRVVTIKTSVSGQLAQVRNTLSGYQGELNEANLNWVQLDPFFAIARVQKNASALKVVQLLSRSGTPAERWNAAYLEAALKINRAKQSKPVMAQLFKDRAGNKFMLLRFSTSKTQEIVLATMADYFQKYFDIERGNRNKSLLITNEKILAAHTEADYLASISKESQLSPKLYIIEKEAIVGTNLTAVSYIPKNKVAAGFVVPWSIVGVVLGFGCILVAILFYTLDPIEKRVERYRRQEREQIYKDTVQQTAQELGGSVGQVRLGVTTPTAADAPTAVTQTKANLTPQPATTESPFEELTKTALHEEASAQAGNSHEARIAGAADEAPLESTQLQEGTKFVDHEGSRIEIIDLFDRKPQSEGAMEQDLTVKQTIAQIAEKAQLETEAVPGNQFITLDEEKIDLDEIEKALALDDFEQEETAALVSPVGADLALEKNLKPQKVSLDLRGGRIEEPQFKFNKKDFKVDELKVVVRRPERS